MSRSMFCEPMKHHHMNLFCRSISGTCRSEARVAGLRAKGWHVEGYDPGRGSTLS